MDNCSVLITLCLDTLVQETISAKESILREKRSKIKYLTLYEKKLRDVITYKALMYFMLVEEAQEVDLDLYLLRIFEQNTLIE